MQTPSPPPPFDIPAAWRGADVERSTPWWIELQPRELDELRAAVETASLSGKPTVELTRADFPLPRLASTIEEWMRELDEGLGFLLIRGLPVNELDTLACEQLYWGLGLYMGRAVSQNTDGDLLGHVRDTGEDPNARGVRLYKTRAEQDFHTDGADIISLLCLTGARTGGVSRVVSSVTIYNEILRRAPELAPTLFERFPFDRQGQEKPGEPGWFEFPICRMNDGQLGTFFIPWYIRESQDHDDAPRLSDDQTRCIELIETIANEPGIYLDMHFAPGDIQLLRNSVILHKRTAYEDWPEAHRKRHLLRLWLSAPEFAGRDDRLNKGL